MAAAAVRDNGADRSLWPAAPGVGPPSHGTVPPSTLAGVTAMARPGVNPSQQAPLGGTHDAGLPYAQAQLLEQRGLYLMQPDGDGNDTQRLFLRYQQLQLEVQSHDQQTL